MSASYNARSRVRNVHLYRGQAPWEGKGKHFSKEFEAFALTLCCEMPVKKASQILGETDQKLWRMLHAHVAEGYDQLPMETVTCIGVDEMNIRKGHPYITVFADLQLYYLSLSKTGVIRVKL